jgi:quercetin dioxygenase-like cupin family protein
MSSTTAPAFRPRNVEPIPRGGTEIIDVLGIRMEWKVTEQDTGHQYCLFEMTVPPGTGVPLHHHAPQETFWVVDGELEFGRVGGAGPEWFRIAAGDTINVPSWAFHGFRNSGKSNARMLLLCAAGLEPFFREVGVSVVSGVALAAGPPSQAEIERVFKAALKIPCYSYSVPW